MALAAAAVGYCVLVVVAYLHLTSPGSPWPNIHELNRILFDTAKPVSQIERLLETPEGEMNRGGSMRPAFTDQSLGWEELIKQLSAGEIATLRGEREGERLALLDWVRSGGNRAAYDADDYTWANSSASIPISAAYLASESGDSATAARRIRIRSLVHDRCVTCHGENGRHDVARFIELDTYDRLEPHLQPEPEALTGRRWLIAALMLLFPLALISAPLFFLTGQSRPVRAIVIAFTLAGQMVMTVAWTRGPSTPLMMGTLLLAAAVAAIGSIIQIAACVLELLAIEQSH